MKRYLLLIPVLLTGMMFFMGQKANDPSPRWSPAYTPILPSELYGKLPVVVDYFHPVTQPRVYDSPMGTFVVSPNIRVRPTSVTSQTEVVIVSHPTLPILFGSSNAAKISGGSFINEGVYVSTNNGLSWFGSDTMNAPNLNDQRGDPGPTIDKDGRFIQTHLSSVANFGAVNGIAGNFSTNNGSSWSSSFLISNSSQDDKNLACSDPTPSSPFYGHSYVAWCRFTGGTSGNGQFSKTSNGGVSWTAPLQINTSPANHFSQGHDVRTGPNGEVYVSWVAENATSPFTADFMGFAKSTNGGASFTVTENAIDMNGSRSFNFGGWGTRVNDFTRMDVDLTGGPRNGWIYVVNTQNSLSPAGSDPDVILSRSTNGGTTWTAHRVNQDALNNGKSQWFPVVEVDASGGVNVVYMDNRNFPPTDSAAIFMSRSIDGGNTWEDFEVSDHHFRPIPDPNFGGGYYGDYIGLTSSGGKLHALWMDNKAGIYNAWYANVTIANDPLTAFNLTSPAAGTIVTSLPGSTTPVTFNWDNSAAGASYKWIFGTSLPTRQITMPSGSNSLTMTLGQLDGILAGLGVAPGGQLAGSWDVWAFRPNPPANDSLKAANGPRTVTLRRGQPSLTAFNLLNPPTNTTIVTSNFNSSNINFNWTRSGSGTTYKWKFGSPSLLSTTRFNIASNGSGFDSVFTVQNSALDAMLGGIGVNPGDSLVGQWAVYAYSGSDSLKSTQTFNLTLKRQGKGDVLVAYDSSLAACRTSRDSVTAALSSLGVTFDLWNRGTQDGTTSISFRGYKKVMLLGEGTSVFSARVKDSLKAYMNAGGTSITTKSKVIVYAEDIGYQFGRTGSSYIDLDFANNYLGFDFVADAPNATSGAQGLRGDHIWNGLRDSCAGPWPDVLKMRTGVGTHVLYRFRRHENNPDSANCVGTYRTNWNVAVMGVDVESLRPAVGGPAGSTVRRFVKGALDYVDNIPVNISNENLIPVVYELSQNYPNPFNPVTKIQFALPQQGLVSLKVYDITGREIAKLVNEVKPAGYHSVEFNGNSLSSGVYFYRIEASDFVQTRKMLLVK